MNLNFSRSLQLWLITLILLIAAALRIVNLSRIPPGFHDDEIANIQIAETVRIGTVASFYNAGNYAGGHEGLYPVLEAISTGILGDGLFCYRILPLWCGLISVALAFALGRRLFGPIAGLSAAITLAVTFWPVLLSRSVIRETLLLPLMLLFLLMLVRAVHLTRLVSPDTPVTWHYGVLGVLIAALAYTHWAGLIAAPLLVLFLVYLITTRQPISRRVLGQSGFALLLAAILGIPYLTFSLRSPSLSGLHVYWANRPDSILNFFVGAVKTLAGVVITGDPAPQHNLFSGPLIGPIGGILLIAGLVVAMRHRRAPNKAFVLIALIMTLLPALWSRSSADFANLTVTLPALALLVGLGASKVFEGLPAVQKAGRAITLTAVVTGASAVIVAFMLFNLWANNSNVERVFRGQLGRIAAYLNQTWDNLATSICTFNLGHDPVGDGNSNQAVSDAALLDLMVHRSDLSLRYSDCLNGFILVNGGAGQRLAYSEPKAASDISPAFAPWLKVAQPVQDDRLNPGSVVQLAVDKALADALGRVTLAHVDWEPYTGGPSQQAVLPVRMGGYLTFEGYTLDTTKIYKPGDVVTIVTYWRADGDQIPDLRVFGHILRNPNAEPVLQDDTLSIDSSLLHARDVFIQVLNIPLPASFPGGQYFVSIGAYSNETGQRLPIYDQDQPRGDRLFLSPITVQG